MVLNNFTKASMMRFGTLASIVIAFLLVVNLIFLSWFKVMSGLEIAEQIVAITGLIATALGFKTKQKKLEINEQSLSNNNNGNSSSGPDGDQLG